MSEYEIWDGKSFRGVLRSSYLRGEAVTLPPDPNFDTRFGRRRKAITFRLMYKDGKLVIDARRKSKRQIDYLIKTLGE